MEEPNLLVIYTDEHNFRTLGCYRKLLEEQGQSEIWGDGIIVDTPNIDSLADEGMIFRNFYSAYPICTPSRASLLTGKYPHTMNMHYNNANMEHSETTFGEILQSKGYHTGWIGKWHLSGPEKPGFLGASVREHFGFEDTEYLYNRGNFKYFEVDESDGTIYAYTDKDIGNRTFSSDTYSTDFLFERSLYFLRKQKDFEKPFALVVSIPDPHGPNSVREPYESMYNDMQFEVPKTTQAAMERNPAAPNWNSMANRKKTVGYSWNKENVNAKDRRVEAMMNSLKRQSEYTNYFGMVKLIDDYVGKVLNFLKTSGLESNTIVVFSSDHGDLVGEHLRDNKSQPYETSAGVPFILKYPGHISSGSVFNSAMSSIDFAPSMLSLMGLSGDIQDDLFHGNDRSNDILLGSDSNGSETDIVVSYRIHATDEQWISATTSRYKLVISDIDDPWLFDRKEDPNELFNVYGQEAYNSIADELKTALLNEMNRFDGFPSMSGADWRWESSSCRDSEDIIPFTNRKAKFICSDLDHPKKMNKLNCSKKKVYNSCPLSCGVCAS